MANSFTRFVAGMTVELLAGVNAICLWSLRLQLKWHETEP